MGKEVVTRGGKPFQSKLAPYEAEVKSLKSDGVSVRAIAEEMRVRHGLAISHNAVASFLRTHGARRRSFLDGISETRRTEASLGELASKLSVLSPYSVLDRGYSLTTDESGAVLKDASSVSPGSLLHTRLAKGAVVSVVR